VMLAILKFLDWLLVTVTKDAALFCPTG